MRRPLVALTVLSCLGLVACEDGPTQTFKPAGSNAGKQNNGNTPGVSDPATQGFNNQTGGTTQVDICTGPQKAARWAKMVTEPIKPPRYGGGLDLAGGDTWVGLTINEAEKINCQSDQAGDQFGDGELVNTWGDGGSLWAEYRISTHKIRYLGYWAGYTGTLDLTSRDGKDQFKIPVLTQPTKNGMPYSIDWGPPAVSTGDPVKFNNEINEIYDALLATYAPGLAQDLSCLSSGGCIAGNFGDIAYMFFPALGTGLWIASHNAPQPTPSIFNRIDMYLSKTMPFSLAYPVLKMDAEGPTATTLAPLGINTAPCKLVMGATFDSFLKDCVKVTGDNTKDTTEYNKLVGGLSHGTERFHFDVQGVDVNFTDEALKDNDIVHDKDLPHGTDHATSFAVDQSTLGKIVNDRVGGDPTKGRDNHGTGLVYLEFARLVQAELNKFVATIPGAKQYQLGDPACTTLVDPNAPVYPLGCTGFEGFITTAKQPTGDPGLDKLALGKNAYVYINSGMALGLKPGHPKATFCLDTTGDINTGYNYCSVQGDLFSTSYARILNVLGRGKVSNLPPDAQDVRFFWKQYVQALIKYFQVATSANENPAGVHAQIIDQDALFFDSIGAGQFELGEYVDRRFANATTPPTDILIEADVRNGIFDAYSFSRDLFRGETAIYQSVLENPADGIGQEQSALLSNVFGSPVLKSGWSDAGGHTAYECATTTNAAVLAACGNQPVPLDGNGNPRLLRYKGAMGSNSTAFTLGPTPIKIAQTFTNIQSAMISMPVYQNPYDSSSTKLPPLSILIPWIPKQPGIGFPVALTGTLDKFVTTAQLDFSGTTISANVDYDAVIDPKTLQPMADGSLQFLAVETTDFLGEVFLCQDAPTGDLLGVRMYTPVATILNWLAAHPGSYSNCGFIIRYSPYGNYADYITTLANGVRLGITQGGGFGRVVDVTLFVPGQ